MTRGTMPKKKPHHLPTEWDEMMADQMYLFADQLIDGKLSGVAIVAVDNAGNDSYFFLNKASKKVLGAPLTKLLALYNHVGGGSDSRVNAPNTNWSRRSH